MVGTIKSVLMSRDGLTSEEADAAIEEAKSELMERIENGDMPFDFCEEQFGLEPDYLFELM